MNPRQARIWAARALAGLAFTATLAAAGCTKANLPSDLAPSGAPNGPAALQAHAGDRLITAQELNWVRDYTQLNAFESPGVLDLNTTIVAAPNASMKSWHLVFNQCSGINLPGYIDPIGTCYIHPVTEHDGYFLAPLQAQPANGRFEVSHSDVEVLAYLSVNRTEWPATHWYRCSAHYAAFIDPAGVTITDLRNQLPDSPSLPFEREITIVRGPGNQNAMRWDCVSPAT